MDDLAVARGDAGADAGRCFRHHHVMAIARGGTGDGQADDTGTDHQDLHATFCPDGMICNEALMDTGLNHHLPKIAGRNRVSGVVCDYPL